MKKQSMALETVLVGVRFQSRRPRTQMGPDILAASGGSSTRFSPNLFLGISMLL